MVDIQAEIDKALTFEPALNKLVIATSLPKDQKVEEYVRKKSVDHVSQNLFSIQICFWEFFERKIPEFQMVYDWYLKHENYARLSGVSLTFQSNKIEIELNPKFKKTITTYSNQPIPKIVNDIVSRYGIFQQPLMMGIDHYKDWEQYCWFELVVNNTGKKVIEDYKIELDFEGKFEKVGTEKPDAFNHEKFRTNVKSYSNSVTSLFIQPYEPVLVPSDRFLIRSIYIKPKVGIESKVTLKWKLLSRDFEDSGELTILIVPKYLIERKTEYVDQLQQETEIVEISKIQRKASFSPFGGYGDDISNMIFE